ncbi:MAG: hypothetical protein GF411_19635 [Candidatus Lokiarchaeota archaeon]|nr:hypothetical protein [Candidatus Lokiarchaeota archaeon]
MDYTLAMNISGLVVSIIISFSLLIYVKRIREIYGTLTIYTQRALTAFGIAGIFVTLSVLAGMMEPLRFIITGFNALFLGFVLIAQMNILFQEGNRARNGTIITAFLIVPVIFENIQRLFTGTSILILFAPILALFLIATFFFALTLLKENPTIFTGSLTLLLLMYIMTWWLASTGFVWSNPEYYIFVNAPLIVGAAIFGSIRKPPRTMITILLFGTGLTICIPLIIVALSFGTYVIWSFVLACLITGLCILAPLDFFLGELTRTEARVPKYIALVLGSISLLLFTHSLSWAVYISQNEVFNRYMIWFDVLLGCFGLTGITLAAASTALGERGYSVTREIIISFCTFITILAIPEVADGRWVAGDLWILLGPFLIWSIVLFIRTSWRLYKIGAGRAASRFVLFVISALLAALSAMYVEDFQFELALILLGVAAAAAIGVSPPFAKIISTLRGTSSQQSS